jgi:hypothetical protein
VERIRLISVADGKGYDTKPAWVVTMAYYPNVRDAEPMLTTVWKISKADYDDADVVRVARHLFQGLCGHLSEEASDWKLEKEEFEALRKSAKSPSSGTGKTT